MTLRFPHPHHAMVRSTCAIAASLLCLNLAAQTAPDAGALLRQTERSLNIPTPPTVLPRREAPPPAMVSPGQATVTVSRFQFVGNTLLGEAQLAAAVAPYLSRPLTFVELQQAANAVAEAYREAGWIVRAYLPKQDIEGGVVTIQIVEAVFGKTQLQGLQPERVQASRLIDIVHSAQVPGQPVHADQIDRALLLMDDLPGISVVGHLVEGQREGETDLGLSVTDEALITGNVTLDNTGSRSTGADRLSANVSVNSPTRRGDAWIVNLLKTQGSEYQRTAYSVPLGNRGFRAGVHYSHLNYGLIGDFASLAASGTAKTAGLDLSYPLVRSQLRNLNVAVSYDKKTFDNMANATASSYDIKAYTLSLNGNQFDNWGGGGANAATLAVTLGEKSTDSSYSKLNLSLSRQQTLREDLSLFVAASWQVASKNLDSSEKIYLGGAGGVRAYPSNEGGGSEGRTLTAELRHRLADRWSMTGFYDYGWAVVNPHPVATPASPGNYNLQGYGVSLAWQGPGGLEVKATAAQRINTNPLQTTQGMDTDGSHKALRMWVNTSVAF